MFVAKTVHVWLTTTREPIVYNAPSVLPIIIKVDRYVELTVYSMKVAVTSEGNPAGREKLLVLLTEADV